MLSFVPDAVDFFLNGELVQAGKRQTQKQTDSPVESDECLSERLFDLLWRTLHRRGIRHSPMSGHRLARPDWTNFLGRVIADGEYKIEFRRAGPGEFIPVLAARAVRRYTGTLDLSQPAL
jgi:hypothetical protein